MVEACRFFIPNENLTHQQMRLQQDEGLLVWRWGNQREDGGVVRKCLEGDVALAACFRTVYLTLFFNMIYIYIYV